MSRAVPLWLKLFCLFAAVMSVAGLKPEKASEQGLHPAPAAQNDAFERLPNGDVRLGHVTVHPATRTLSFPATVNMDAGILEVLIATPVGRLHESLLQSPVEPLHFQTMLYLLNLKNGPRQPDAEQRRGDIVDIELEYRTESGELKQEPVENWITDRRSGATMQRYGWIFIGSSFVEGRFQATVGGNLVLTYNIADSVLELASDAGMDDTLFVVNEEKQEPKLNQQVRVIVIPRGENQ